MLGVKLRVTVPWAVSSVQASVAQPGPRGQTCQQGQAVRVCPCKSVLCIRAHRLKRVVDVIPCHWLVSVCLPSIYAPTSAAQPMPAFLSTPVTWGH